METPTNVITRGGRPRWIGALIVGGAGAFTLGLLLSAVFDPRIRLLHALQALIYVAVVWLTWRNSAWGFGSGAIIAAFWNYLYLFVVSSIGAIFGQVWVLLHDGRVDQPDLLIPLVPAMGHLALIVGCIAGFVRMQPRAREWASFLGGGVLAVGYLALIIVVAGPQYIGLLKRAFGL